MSEEETDTDAGAKKRLTDAEFAAAKELYELGKGSISELATQFGVHRNTLSQKLKDAGARKGSRATEVATATKEVVERFAEKRAERIEETRVFGYGALKQLAMIGMKMVQEQVKRSTAAGNLTLDPTDGDARTLNRLNKFFAENMQARLDVLQADEHIDAESLPMLVIEDLTDKDILDHFISTGVLDENATIEDLNTENLG